MTLARRSQAVLGTSYARGVMAFRLDRARQLLAGEGASVVEAAEALAFGDPAVFRHAYRGRFGRCPSEDCVQRSRRIDPMPAPGER